MDGTECREGAVPDKARKKSGAQMEMTMTFLKTVATALALSVGAMTFTSPARANANDAIIAGAAGFAAGTLLGGAAAYPRGYYGAPGYYAPRAYYARPYYARPYYAPRRAYYAPRYAYPYRYRHPVRSYCYNTRDCW
jgi:hypothetical protein